MDSVIINDLDVRQRFVVAVIDVVVSYYFFFYQSANLYQQLLCHIFLDSH